MILGNLKDSKKSAEKWDSLAENNINYVAKNNINNAPNVLINQFKPIINS